MPYEKITPEIIEKLKAVVGPKNVVTDADAMQPYSHDEVTDPAYHRMPEAVVFAETAEESQCRLEIGQRLPLPRRPARCRYRPCLRRRPGIRRHRLILRKDE